MKHLYDTDASHLVCCIYHKSRPFDESSSESSSDSSDSESGSDSEPRTDRAQPGGRLRNRNRPPCPHPHPHPDSNLNNNNDGNEGGVDEARVRSGDSPGGVVHECDSDDDVNAYERQPRRMDKGKGKSE